MIFAKWESVIFADNIAILGGISFGAVAFLELNFLMILLICSAVAKEILYLFSDLFTLLFMLMILLMILMIFLNYRLNSRHIKSFAVWISFYLGGFTRCFFHNICLMRIEWICYFLFNCYILFHVLESTRCYQKLRILCW